MKKTIFLSFLYALLCVVSSVTLLAQEKGLILSKYYLSADKNWLFYFFFRVIKKIIPSSTMTINPITAIMVMTLPFSKRDCRIIKFGIGASDWTCNLLNP